MVGRRARGGTALLWGVRLLALPLVLVIGLFALPTPSGSDPEPVAARSARLEHLAAGADAAAVSGALARALTNPAVGRSLDRLLLDDRLNGFQHELVQAATTVFGSRSALAGRLLGTAATRADRERVAQLGRALRDNLAVRRLVDAASTLRRQAWPLRVAITEAAVGVRAGPATDRALDALRAIAGGSRFRSLATSVSGAVTDPNGAALVAALPPEIVGGYLSPDRLTALRLGDDHRTGDLTSSAREGLDVAAGIVLVGLAATTSDSGARVVGIMNGVTTMARGGASADVTLGPASGPSGLAIARNFVE
jgi:hypothetical protein